MSTFAARYDRYRPAPPPELPRLLTQLAGVDRPRLVVDLGSGTGLSTRAWSRCAERVVGVEPDEAMRAVAEARGGAEYLAGDSAATDLADGCADVITCSQSLHWMDRDATFGEAARVLRRGGVFAAYDYDPVPAVHPELDAAAYAVLRRANELRRERDVWAPWPSRSPAAKEEHLPRMLASGRFRYVREVMLHSVEEGDAERLLGLLRSYGAVEMHKDDELGLDELEQAARRVLAERTLLFWFGYRVRVGVV